MSSQNQNASNSNVGHLMKRHDSNRFFLCLLFAFLLCSPKKGLAASSSETCSVLFNLGNYVKAASCYLLAAKKFSAHKKLSRIQKKIKGLYLSNAAAGYQKAAAQTSNKNEGYYLRELAANLFQQYLDEKLCTKEYRCKAIRRKLLIARAEITYANLALVGNKKNQHATVKLEGYKYKKLLEIPPNWTGKLRPGKYQASIYHLGRLIKKLEIKLTPSQSRVLTLPKQKRRTPAMVRLRPRKRNPIVLPRRVPPRKNNAVFPIVLLGIGGAAIVGGGILVALAQGTFSTYNTNYQKALKFRTDNPTGAPPNEFKKMSLDSQRELGITQTIAGWATVGGGVLFGGIGAILLATSSPSKKVHHPTPTLLQTVFPPIEL